MLTNPKTIIYNFVPYQLVLPNGKSLGAEMHGLASWGSKQQGSVVLEILQISQKGLHFQTRTHPELRTAPNISG